MTLASKTSKPHPSWNSILLSISLRESFTNMIKQMFDT